MLDGMPVLGGGVLLLAVLLFLLWKQARMRRELAALRASEALFRRLTEDVSDVIWRADPNLFITYINPTDEKLRGRITSYNVCYTKLLREDNPMPKREETKRDDHFYDVPHGISIDNLIGYVCWLSERVRNHFHSSITEG